MKMLFLDRSTVIPSAAAFSHGRPVMHWSLAADAGRAPDWMAQIAETFIAAGLSADAFDAYGVGLGPGSFSGIRSAIAACQGMALAKEKPVYGIATAAAMAWRKTRLSGTSGIVNVIGDARRGTIWYAAYRVESDARMTLADGRPMTQTAADFNLVPYEGLSSVLIPGAPVVTADAERLACKAERLELILPAADDFASVFFANAETCPVDPLPVYLHPAVAAKV